MSINGKRQQFTYRAWSQQVWFTIDISDLLIFLAAGRNTHMAARAKAPNLRERVLGQSPILGSHTLICAPSLSSSAVQCPSPVPCLLHISHSADSSAHMMKLWLILSTFDYFILYWLHHIIPVIKGGEDGWAHWDKGPTYMSIHTSHHISLSHWYHRIHHYHTQTIHPSPLYWS